jgi:glycosyltransferase involved in cell wall biosynthesis
MSSNDSDQYSVLGESLALRCKVCGMSKGSNFSRVNVFVLLGYGFGANSWERKHALGLIPGINDRLAYGYYRAAGEGWSIEYSDDHDEGRLVRFSRAALRRLLGFDLIHVWRNRRRMLRADVIWTHTELEHLGVLLLFRLLGRSVCPKLIANCVWLFDRWPYLSRVRRMLYQQLLKDAAVVTTFSPENLKVARQVLPSVRCECVLFGILTHEMALPRRQPVHNPIRIAALGNDIDRDWGTLLNAFGNIDRYQVRIGSTRIRRGLVDGLPNVEIIQATAAHEVRALYEWSDFVVVPLRPNLHASGITVVFESIISGVPSICTDTGGLRTYFSDVEVAYVPPQAPDAMRAMVDELSEDHERRSGMTIKAQERMIAADLSSHGFAMRNRRLSEHLLGVSRETIESSILRPAL